MKWLDSDVSPADWRHVPFDVPRPNGGGVPTLLVRGDDVDDLLVQLDDVV